MHWNEVNTVVAMPSGSRAGGSGTTGIISQVGPPVLPRSAQSQSCAIVVNCGQ